MDLNIQDHLQYENINTIHKLNVYLVHTDCMYLWAISITWDQNLVTDSHCAETTTRLPLSHVEYYQTANIPHTAPK